MIKLQSPGKNSSAGLKNTHIMKLVSFTDRCYTSIAVEN
jgi:hypothetical protein